MKKIFIQIFAYISPVLTLAQIVSPDGGPVATFGGGTLTVSEVDPGPEIIDTWEPPVMEGDRSVIWIHGLVVTVICQPVMSLTAGSRLPAPQTSITRWNHAGPTILM